MTEWYDHYCIDVLFDIRFCYRYNTNRSSEWTLSRSRPSSIDSRWIIVDSSGWIEYIADGIKAANYAAYLESPQKLLLPSIVVYEVHKKLIRERGKNLADLFLSQAYAFSERLIALDLPLSILASRLSLEYQLPMADSIIYATSRIHAAPVVTSDEHFSGLPGVVLI